MIVAIDGPAGSGKSSTTKLISQKMGWKYLDSGAMYRAVTVYFLENDISYKYADEVLIALNKIDIEFKGKKNQQIYLNGKNVTIRIREDDVNNHVSSISSLPSVRKFLIGRQRKFAKLENAIMEGRDIGTEVFPNADIKIYLTASIESRAYRRYYEFQKKGREISLDKIMDKIRKRDQNDMQRKHSPLRIAKDAIVLDTTGMSLEEQVDQIIKLIEQKA